MGKHHVCCFRRRATLALRVGTNAQTCSGPPRGRREPLDDRVWARTRLRKTTRRIRRMQKTVLQMTIFCAWRAWPILRWSADKNLVFALCHCETHDCSHFWKFHRVRAHFLKPGGPCSEQCCAFSRFRHQCGAFVHCRNKCFCFVSSPKNKPVSCPITSELVWAVQCSPVGGSHWSPITPSELASTSAQPKGQHRWRSAPPPTPPVQIP